MPKSQIVEPAEERKAGSVPLAEIPLNQYQQDLAKEKETYGADALVGMYEDMLLIREFESMLQSIKTQGSYEGIEYDHKGPAHLSIGQEASAVGQAFLLDVDDHILGSHRSHGEILAKGMSSIRELDDDAVLEVMKNFLKEPNSRGVYIKAEGRLSKEMKERCGVNFCNNEEKWENGNCFIFDCNFLCH